MLRRTKYNRPRNQLNGLDMRNKLIKPVVEVMITIKVDVKSLSKLKASLKRVIITTLKTTVSAGGILLPTTFNMKSPLTKSVLGSKAKKKEGTLIVQVVIRLNWIGR